MNAPATHASIPLAQVHPSSTNPRKHFDEAQLADLTASVKKHDVLQPILVRPIAGVEHAYEIVAGERRYRAAKAAGLVFIPAISRELSDAEALEIQVVENLQRADLHPLEEAQGYEALLACTHADGRAYTAEEIAAKVGKSKSYVYQRMKLTALCPAVREAFLAGDLDASRALLVARLGDDDQVEAFERITDEYRPMGYRAAREYIHRNFMLELQKPPFDPTVIYFAPGGAQPIGVPCAECPKRTGNAPDLFDDVKSGDVCTDPTCFQEKTAAAVELEAEKKRAKGFTVITGAEARKVLPNSWGGLKGGYVQADEYCYETKESGQWSKLLAKSKVPTTLIANPHKPGEWVKAYEKKAALEALAKAGMLKAEPKKSKAQAAVLNQNRAETEAIELAIHMALRDKVLSSPTIPIEVLRLVAREAWNAGEPDMEIQDLAAPKGTLDWKIMDASQCAAILIDTALPDIDYEMPERHALAKTMGIDVAAVKKQAKKDLQAARAAEEKAKAATETKPAKGETKKPKAGTKPAKAATKAPPAKPTAPCVTPMIVPLIKPLAKESA